MIYTTIKQMIKEITKNILCFDHGKSVNSINEKSLKYCRFVVIIILMSKVPL